MTVRPAIQQILDATTDAPAWIRNGRHDILAMNDLARALYSPVLADPRRPANTTRFVYLHPREAEVFFVDYDTIAKDAAAMLRLEAGRNPHDKALIALVGELSTQSELFRQRWASQDVRFHRSGRKRLRHPAVGQLDLDFEALDLPPNRASNSTSTPPPPAHPPPTPSSSSRPGPPARKYSTPSKTLHTVPGDPETPGDDRRHRHTRIEDPCPRSLPTRDARWAGPQTVPHLPGAPTERVHTLQPPRRTCPHPLRYRGNIIGTGCRAAGHVCEIVRPPDRDPDRTEVIGGDQPRFVVGLAGNDAVEASRPIERRPVRPVTSDPDRDRAVHWRREHRRTMHVVIRAVESTGPPVNNAVRTANDSSRTSPRAVSRSPKTSKS